MVDGGGSQVSEWSRGKTRAGRWSLDSDGVSVSMESTDRPQTTDHRRHIVTTRAKWEGGEGTMWEAERAGQPWDGIVAPGTPMSTPMSTPMAGRCEGRRWAGVGEEGGRAKGEGRRAERG